MSRAQRPLYRRLLERTDVRIDHRAADDGAYRVVVDVSGLSVLLIDDTFTTGARVQSAASALSLAGADVVAAVVLGRFVRPQYSAETQEVWDRQKEIGFDFDLCCLDS